MLRRSVAQFPDRCTDLQRTISNKTHTSVAFARLKKHTYIYLLTYLLTYGASHGFSASDNFFCCFIGCYGVPDGMMVTMPVRFQVPGQWHVVSDVDLTSQQSSELNHIVAVRHSRDYRARVIHRYSIFTRKNTIGGLYTPRTIGMQIVLSSSSQTFYSKHQSLLSNVFLSALLLTPSLHCC